MSARFHRFRIVSASLFVAGALLSVGCQSSGGGGDDLEASGGSFEKRLANNQMYSGAGAGGSAQRRSRYEQQGYNAKSKTKLRSDYRVSEFKSGEHRTNEFRGVSDYRTSDYRGGNDAYATNDFRGSGDRARADGQAYKTDEYKTGASRAQGQTHKTYDNVQVNNDRYLDEEPVDNIVPLSGREESFTFKDIKKMVGQ